MSYLVNLDKFYGPLDLLLYLLEREEIDIYEIPIARITNQYMTFIEKNGYGDLDNIGDFLSMASYLLKLKSKMLLPEYMAEEEADGGIDPREELVHRLLVYKQYKQLGEYLAQRYNDDSQRLYFRCGQDEPLETGINSSVRALLRAWDSLLNRGLEQSEYDLPQGMAINETMERIMHLLASEEQPVMFPEILRPVLQRRELAVYFLALLELIRLQKVEACQQGQFSTISLKVRTAVDQC